MTNRQRDLNAVRRSTRTVSLSYFSSSQEPGEETAVTVNVQALWLGVVGAATLVVVGVVGPWRRVGTGRGQPSQVPG